MNDRHAQAAEAIRDSWDFWLSQHDYSVPDTIKAAVMSAWDSWLAQHPVLLGDLIEAAVKDAAAQRLARNREGIASSRTDDMADPWQSEDPDELPDPRALLAYWKTANASPDAQRRLVADQWHLWRLARDLTDALERSLGTGEKS